MSGRAPSGASGGSSDNAKTSYSIQTVGGFGLNRLDTKNRTDTLEVKGQKNKLFDGKVRLYSGVPSATDACYCAPSPENISKFIQPGWSQASVMASFLLTMYGGFPCKSSIYKKLGEVLDINLIADESLKYALIHAMHFADIGADIQIPSISISMNGKIVSTKPSKFEYVSALSITGLKIIEVSVDDLIAIGGGKVPNYWNRYELVDYVTNKYLSEGNIWHLSKSEIAKGWDFFAEIIGDNQMAYKDLLKPLVAFPPTPDMYPAICLKDKVNIRESPSASGKVSGTANKNDKLFQLALLSAGADWVNIYHVKSGKYGYISKDFVEAVSPDSPSAQKTTEPEHDQPGYSDTESNDFVDTDQQGSGSENNTSSGYTPSDGGYTPPKEPPASTQDDYVPKEEDNTLKIALAVGGALLVAGGAAFLISRRKKSNLSE